MEERIIKAKVVVPNSDPAIVGNVVPTKGYTYETWVTSVNASNPDDIVVRLEQGYNVNSYYVTEVGIEDVYYEDGELVVDEEREY